MPRRIRQVGARVVSIASKGAQLQAYQPEPRVRTTSASVAGRRFCGPTGDELFLLCRPQHAVVGVTAQAEAVYEAVLEALAAEDMDPGAIVAETVFMRRIREHLGVVRSARSRILEGVAPRACRPATTFIGQPPLVPHVHLEVAVVAVHPRSAEASSTRGVSRAVACPCEACAPGVHGRLVRLGDETHLYAGNVYGAGRGPFEEASDMFHVAEDLLAAAAMRFGDVIRSWIYVRDIDRDYDALNEARREFFQARGIEIRPASTGIQGVPYPDTHDFSLSLYAVRSPRPLDLTVMSSPMLNEAWSYGADFSRGLRVVDANKVALYVSGTASIDEAGRTVHAGDFAAQATRMLRNIASLLASQGAGLENLVSAVVYLRHPHDAPVLRAMLRERGLASLPCALVKAPLCRRDLLCEAEAVAMLPLPSSSA